VQADYADFAPPVNGFSANVLVVTTPASGISSAEAMQMEIANTRATPGISGLQVDSNSAVQVGGASGYRGQFRYSMVLVASGLWV